MKLEDPFHPLSVLDVFAKQYKDYQRATGSTPGPLGRDDSFFHDLSTQLNFYQFKRNFNEKNIMKLNKIILPLALALVATLATTGCRHGFNGKITTLPGHQAGVVGGTEGPGTTLPPGSQLPPPDMPIGTGVTTQTGGGATSPINIGDYIPDRTALAAYTVHFKFDSAVVQDSEQANVASVGQALSDHSLALQIEGHCDERGTEEYNRALGERRALALREALAKDGIDPMRVITISYGKDKPVDDGHDEAAWAKNRRGEFILLHPKTPVQ
jgi:peptidoglycan-associated lipoprotein